MTSENNESCFDYPGLSYDVERILVLGDARIGEDLFSVAEDVTEKAKSFDCAVGRELNGTLIVGRPGLSSGHAIAGYYKTRIDQLRGDKLSLEMKLRDLAEGAGQPLIEQSQLVELRLLLLEKQQAELDAERAKSERIPLDEGVVDFLTEARENLLQRKSTGIAVAFLDNLGRTHFCIWTDPRSAGKDAESSARLLRSLKSMQDSLESRLRTLTPPIIKY